LILEKVVGSTVERILAREGAEGNLHPGRAAKDNAEALRRRVLQRRGERGVLTEDREEEHRVHRVGEQRKNTGPSKLRVNKSACATKQQGRASSAATKAVEIWRD